MSLTVLVVDDDVLDREAVRRALRAAGVDASVVETSDARQVTHLARAGVDCILLDYNLPGSDGASVLRELREAAIDVPVIVLTGRGDEQTAVELMKAGAVDYLSKHALTADRLERSVRHALTVAAAERERRELLAREQFARQEAQAANRVKDEFLATLSHELRTPLNAILGWTRLLASGELDDETQRRGFEVIERNVSLQVKLIDDLLDISRIVTGKLAVDKAPISLAQVVAAALESQRPMAEAAGLVLEHGVTGEERPVLGDATRLQQVVTNLLSNAIKFTPRDGRVSVNLTFTGSEAVLSIHDTGLGIAPEFLPHIFERFRQGDSTIARRHAGLGLGLAIVRHLIDVHAGRILAESAGRGKGATFRVMLPTIEAPAAVNGDGTPGELTLDGVCVLLVDQDAESRASARNVLERCGASVLTAADAGEALLIAQEKAFDILLTDLTMPDTDGDLLMRELQARPTRKPVIAAAMIACDSPDERARALAAGFHGHLSKPCEPARLVRTVADLAQLRVTSSSTAGPPR